MKYLTNSNCVIYGIFMLFLSANLSAQEASITVLQDSKFEQILTEKEN